MNDRRWIYVAAFLRATATGLIGVLLGLALAARNLDAAQIGRLVAVGLAGATLGVALVTFGGDRLGRRVSLLLLTLAGTAGAVGLWAGTGIVWLGAACFVGMINGMGRDRGPAPVLEQAVLPSTVTDSERTLAFARYNVVQDLGHALGALLAGAGGFLEAHPVGKSSGYGSMLAVYAVLCLLPAAAYLRLSPRVETPAGESRARRVLHPVSPCTRSVLGRISALFAMDALGGGFLTTALVAYFFHQRFGVGVGTLGAFFFAARLANALSHLGAAWLARRIGLVNTMVFTHLPSSLLLVTVAFAPSFPVAAALFLLREGLVEMDVPTRQSYVMAVVHPRDRTVASGVTQIVRVAGWAIAPAFAGLFMRDVSLYTPLLVGAGLKITYDLLLWRAFRHLRPPEEEDRR